MDDSEGFYMVPELASRERGKAADIDRLFCKKCGERFDADEATDDGWHYRCPNDDCDGAGIGTDLAAVTDVLPSTR
jgi:hypothetical protein